MFDSKHIRQFSTSEVLPSSPQRVHGPEDLTLSFTSKATITAFHLQARYLGLHEMDSAKSLQVP